MRLKRDVAGLCWPEQARNIYRLEAPRRLIYIGNPALPSEAAFYSMRNSFRAVRPLIASTWSGVRPAFLTMVIGS
jgi:hypothetical protein